MSFTKGCAARRPARLGLAAGYSRRGSAASVQWARRRVRARRGGCASRSVRRASSSTARLLAMRVLLALLAAAAAALALPAATAAAARKQDQDFEFDDDVEGAVWRPRRYLYDPNSPLCRTLVCAGREQCLLREERKALCADRARLLRNGDVVVNAVSEAAREDDVFYESSAPAGGGGGGGGGDRDRDRCVGCGSVPRAQFLCGSDNRTYSSLCRLDLHNCVRRPAPPVALACRGFCPCRRRAQDAAHDDWHRRGRRRGRRPLSRTPPRPRGAASAPPPPAADGCAPDKMADRLLDWFSVLMDEAGESPPDRRGFPRDCKPETRWMFAHLDTDGDGMLSSTELYALRHDSRERCLRPFLSGCGAGAGPVARGAWCGCLRRAARPCLALARAHAARAAGGYVPACDHAGYYRPRQCHAALGVCWCVDAHGQELPGSRGKGAPTCPGEKLSANAISLSNETGEDAQEAQELARDAHALAHDAHAHDGEHSERGEPGEHDARGAPADDEDALAAGSGDAELRF
ncbi:LOW QUALITY PROTEIN: proteoglycan Cow [Leguminivora glycinivorella]|uniref:LOW QUALITY PROTEIN: proteoglycan Cow n=1 Tax=Leguminivora glycinivorella TaxID=1035111 RepID=UPI00200E98A1|nr:LOW QUALITY PROTEIN: proteoglycan Cow [Leguminivora glycinivorella]